MPGESVLNALLCKTQMESSMKNIFERVVVASLILSIVSLVSVLSGVLVFFLENEKDIANTKSVILLVSGVIILSMFFVLALNAKIKSSPNSDSSVALRQHFLFKYFIFDNE